MFSDNKLILQLLSLLKQHNISKIVISPGSRHFPIIHSMEADPFFKLYSVVDERSAAFFAIGIIQKTGDPVAVCCTSGTSSLNYGPAVAEAYYQQLPLLLLTADRLPELLNQLEDQMYKQDDVFHNFIKYHGQLQEVKNNFSEWYCNRIINEALLSLSHHGRGPVQLNIPIEKHQHDKFETTTLPIVRKISRTMADADAVIWESYAQKLNGKKILIIWGQSQPMSEKLRNAVSTFFSKFNCIILTDRISNCHHEAAIEDGFMLLKSLSAEEKDALFPDIVLSIFGNYVFNGELKGYLRSNSSRFEHWYISPAGNVQDPFKRLTEIFEMNEAFFFDTISSFSSASLDHSYYKQWKEKAALVTDPVIPYSELYCIGKLIQGLPQHSTLQIANSSPIRMAHAFKMDESIKVFCNRGINGIDGCMSTTVGYASSNDEPVFLIIGDLTFFYDMNGIWNRHLSNKLRILLVNNSGGAVMHMPLKEELGPILPRFVSAGHSTNAKGWVESLGFHYFSADNKTDFDNSINALLDIKTEAPVLLEVFTDKESDVKIYKSYMGSFNKATFSQKVKRKLINKITGILPK